MIRTQNAKWYTNNELVEMALKVVKTFDLKHIGFDEDKYEFVLFKEKPKVEEIRKYHINNIKDEDTIEPHWSLDYIDLGNLL